LAWLSITPFGIAGAAGGVLQERQIAQGEPGTSRHACGRLLQLCDRDDMMQQILNLGLE
jgi:hypothetical protein